MRHFLFQLGLGTAAIALNWLGIDSFRRTREMRKTGRGVRNLLGMTPWYMNMIPEERIREIMIINHNYIIALAAIMVGLGAALILLNDITTSMSA